jgi:hypothetical protein
VRGFFPFCHHFFSFWHYGIAGQYMTTAIGGGFSSLNKTNIVSRNSILSVINQTAVSLKAEFSNVELLLSGSPIQTYDLVVGQLAEMENLIINRNEPGKIV